MFKYIFQVWTILISFVASFDFNCIYSANYDNEYTCINLNLSLYHKGEIASISGRHKEGFNDLKVVNIYLNSELTRRIPLRLADHFPNFLLLNFDCKPKRMILATNHEVCLDEDALYKGAFIGLSKVTHLLLQGHKLNALDGFVFQELENLKVLYLKSNQINKIHKDAFQGIKNLVNLSLSGNFLKEIPMETFDHLPHLMILDLHRNALTSFLQEMLKSKVDLVTLNLNQNRLKTIDKHLIDHLPTVSKVEMEQNDCTNSILIRKGNYGMLYDYRQLTKNCTDEGETLTLLLKKCRNVRKEIENVKEQIENERKTCKEENVQRLLEEIGEAEIELEELEIYREKYVKTPENFRKVVTSRRSGQSTIEQNIVMIHNENERIMKANSELVEATRKIIYFIKFVRRYNCTM